MRLSAYLILLFSVGLILYFMGYAPIINIFNAKGASPLSISCPNTDKYCQQNNATNTGVVLGASILAILGATALGSLIIGYSAIFIIPIVLLIGLLNFFVFPLNFMMDPSFPDIIKYPVLAFFNILTVLAVLNFVRGGV